MLCSFHIHSFVFPFSVPVDVQEEIDGLYHHVPEVHQHFKILNKIGEGGDLNLLGCITIILG